MSDERPVMTVKDVALMRQIVAWRKANEIEFVKRRVYGAPYWIDTFGRTGPRRRSVTVDVKHYSADYELTPIGLDSRDHALFTWLPAASFRQVVDVLVAYGYLPVRFSSAYTAGAETGREDIEHPGPAGEAFRAIVPAVLL